MTPTTRPAAPGVLARSAERWTANFLKSGKFAWPVHEKQRLNWHLLPALRSMTTGHCAYCDCLVYPSDQPESIDHFRPKSRHPEAAFAWENLFYACARCQSHKAERYVDLLLRPDAVDYAFERYFVFNFSTGEIEVHPGAAQRDQERATVTVELLGFNQHGRPGRRLAAIRAAGFRPDSMDDHPYRFALL